MRTFYHTLKQILKETFLLYLIIFSIFFIAIALKLKSSNDAYDVLKNISFSIIASCIFYYINITYPLVKNSLIKTKYLKEKYNIFKRMCINSIYTTFNDLQQDHINPEVLMDINKFTRTFCDNTTTLRPNSIWISIKNNTSSSQISLLANEFVGLIVELNREIKNCNLSEENLTFFNEIIEEHQKDNFEIMDLIYIFSTGSKAFTGQKYNIDSFLHNIEPSTSNIKIKSAIIPLLILPIILFLIFRSY